MALNKEFDPMSEMPGLKKMAPLLLVVVAIFFLWAFSHSPDRERGSAGWSHKVQASSGLLPGLHLWCRT